MKSGSRMDIMKCSSVLLWIDRCDKHENQLLFRPWSTLIFPELCFASSQEHEKVYKFAFIYWPAGKLRARCFLRLV